MILNGQEQPNNYIPRSIGEMLVIHYCKKQNGTPFEMNGVTCEIPDYIPPRELTLVEFLHDRLGIEAIPVKTDQEAAVDTDGRFYVWFIKQQTVSSGATLKSAAYVERDGWGYAL